MSRPLVKWRNTSVSDGGKITSTHVTRVDRRVKTRESAFRVRSLICGNAKTRIAPMRGMTIGSSKRMLGISVLPYRIALAMAFAIEIDVPERTPPSSAKTARRMIGSAMSRGSFFVSGAANSGSLAGPG